MKNEHISNIKRRDLLLNPRKYLWLEIPEEYSNINFSLLLKFIDNYSDYGKEHVYGNAYVRIRKVTNKLLGASTASPKKLKNSKHEIRSIKNTTISKINGKLYLKIPFKISYIFKAIIIIVDEIENQYNIKLPAELKDTIDLSYGIAFYDKFIATYDSYYSDLEENNREKIGYKLKAELYNDFHSENSVFKTIVK